MNNDADEEDGWGRGDRDTYVDRNLKKLLKERARRMGIQELEDQLKETRMKLHELEDKVASASGAARDLDLEEASEEIDPVDEEARAELARMNTKRRT